MENLRFVIPRFFKGAPRESVMIKGELRFVKNPDHIAYGSVVIYTDSHFEPLNIQGYSSESAAKRLIEENGGLWVKQDFDDVSIEDLKEIKSQLSEEWIKGFNNWYNSDY